MSAPLARSGAVLTVGTFDGVHRGHWELLQRVVQRAREKDKPSVLVTFDPHPLRISVGMLPPGRSVRPMDPANTTSPTRAKPPSRE